MKRAFWTLFLILMAVAGTLLWTAGRNTDPELAELRRANALRIEQLRYTLCIGTIVFLSVAAVLATTLSLWALYRLTLKRANAVAPNNEGLYPYLKQPTPDGVLYIDPNRQLTGTLLVRDKAPATTVDSFIQEGMERAHLIVAERALAVQTMSAATPKKLPDAVGPEHSLGGPFRLGWISRALMLLGWMRATQPKPSTTVPQTVVITDGNRGSPEGERVGGLKTDWNSKN